jgi:hypothetical protein
MSFGSLLFAHSAAPYTYDERADPEFDKTPVVFAGLPNV